MLSAVIAAAAAPLVISLRARGWSRVRAALGAWAVVGAIIVGALVLVAIAFVPSITALVDEVQRGVEAIRSGSGELRLPPEIASTIAHVATVITGFIEDELGALASHVATTATIAILSTFLTFFFLLDGDHGAEWVFRVFRMTNGRHSGTASRCRPPRRRPRARDSGLLRGPNGGDVRGHAGARDTVRWATGGHPPRRRADPLPRPLVATSGIVLVSLVDLGLVPALVVLAAAIADRGRTSVRTFTRGRLGGPARPSCHRAPCTPDRRGRSRRRRFDRRGAGRRLPPGDDRHALAAIQPRLPTISSSGPIVPAWLDRLARWSRGLLVGIGLLAGLVVITIQLAAPVLAVVLAAVVAATLAPAAAALRRRGADRQLPRSARRSAWRSGSALCSS